MHCVCGGGGLAWICATKQIVVVGGLVATTTATPDTSTTAVVTLERAKTQ